ncbi:MAG: serine protease [Coriobacteriia bacterium]|nr:serine protease [Coriobacteriia bacterium]
MRESVVAVMGVTEARRKSKTGKHGKKPVETVEYKLGFGSGFCVAEDRYVITAFHVLNDGKAPNPKTHFYVFTVPGNGEPAYHFPVTAIPVQRQDMDIAVLEIGVCEIPDVHLPAIGVTFEPFQDGQRVLTVGFPAPEVHGLNIGPQGNYLGGQFFLKSHANEGIVAAHYDLGSLPVYELNVTWHNGESGGPIVALGDTNVAFSLMQQYRNVQTPHGVVPGPRRGLALSSVEADLVGLGISPAAV